jgi:hypothetical protein
MICFPCCVIGLVPFLVFFHAYDTRKIARWLSLFLEYEFIVVYKTGRTHVLIDVLCRLLDN